METGRASVRRAASVAESSQGTPASSTPEITVGQQESRFRTGRCRNCNPAEILRRYELISEDPSLSRCLKLGAPQLVSWDWEGILEGLRLVRVERFVQIPEQCFYVSATLMSSLKLSYGWFNFY